MKPDLYTTVTERIVAALEQGVIPWITPWHPACAPGGPANLVSGHRYRGVNVLLLNLVQAAHAYPSNRWLTFQQARALGAHVRKGERGCEVVFFKMLEVDQPSAQPHPAGSPKVIPLLRSFTVFNAAQVEGLPPPATSCESSVDASEPIEAAQRLLNDSGAQIHHGGDQAFYRPANDRIYLPEPGAFVSPERYYGVALHELTHWSGHPTRCDRRLLGRQHIEAYAFEELIAEMGSAFLCSQVGIHTELQHASYIESWLGALRQDKRLIFSAASAAQKAADYVLGLQPQAHHPEAASVAESA